jgi:hypothetical protein
VNAESSTAFPLPNWRKAEVFLEVFDMRVYVSSHSESDGTGFDASLPVAVRQVPSESSEGGEFFQLELGSRGEISIRFRTLQALISFSRAIMDEAIDLQLTPLVVNVPAAIDDGA